MRSWRGSFTRGCVLKAWHRQHGCACPFVLLTAGATWDAPSLISLKACYQKTFCTILFYMAMYICFQGVCLHWSQCCNNVFKINTNKTRDDLIDAHSHSVGVLFMDFNKVSQSLSVI